MLFFWTFYSWKLPEKIGITVYTEMLRNIYFSVFNIANNKKCFLSRKSTY